MEQGRFDASGCIAVSEDWRARFELRGALGQGGVADVMEVACRRSGERYALKILREQHRGSEVHRRRLRWEAAVLSRLCLPGVVRLEEAFEDALLLEFLQGGSWCSRLGKAAAPGAVLPWAFSALETLEGLHGRGILHGDVKPENILWTGERSVFVDFALCRWPAVRRVYEVPQGRVLGTPAYCRPARLRGQELDAGDDVHGLAAAVYALLAGEVPVGRGMTEQRRRVLEGDVPPLRVFRRDVPVALEAVLRRAQGLDGKAPYRSASALAQALRQGAEMDGVSEL